MKRDLNFIKKIQTEMDNTFEDAPFSFKVTYKPTKDEIHIKMMWNNEDLSLGIINQPHAVNEIFAMELEEACCNIVIHAVGRTYQDIHKKKHTIDRLLGELKEFKDLIDDAMEEDEEVVVIGDNIMELEDVETDKNKELIH